MISRRALLAGAAGLVATPAFADFPVILPGTHPKARAVMNAMTTPPPGGRRRAIDRLVRALHSADVWSKLGGLWVLGAHAAQAARLNWINPGSTSDMTAVNSPTFTVDRGYTGDGSTAYLNTTAAINTMSPYAQNLAHTGVWSLTEGTNATAEMTNAANTTLRHTSRNAGSNFVSRLSSTNNTTIANSVGSGHSVANRSASNLTTFYVNGASIGTDNDPSTGVPTDALRAAVNTRQIMAVHIGSSLTAAEVLALYSALNAYKTAIGA